MFSATVFAKNQKVTALRMTSQFLAIVSIRGAGARLDGADDGAGQVRNNSESFVAKGGAQNQLHEDGGYGDKHERVDRRAPKIAKPQACFLFPPGAGKQGDAGDRGEEKLGENGMRRGYRWP